MTINNGCITANDHNTRPDTVEVIAEEVKLNVIMNN